LAVEFLGLPCTYSSVWLETRPKRDQKASMSDSLHTPFQLDEIKENASQDKTPDDWFRSPTVKTLKRRQLQLGEFRYAHDLGY
jgi:hypothetical protein